MDRQARLGDLSHVEVRMQVIDKLQLPRTEVTLVKRALRLGCERLETLEPCI